MKLISLPLLWFACACAHLHPAPNGPVAEARNFEYCGGRQWGYILPIGPRAADGFWTRPIKDPKPLLAVFLETTETDTGMAMPTFWFNFVIRSKEDLSVQFPDRSVAVRFVGGTLAGRPEKEFKLPLLFEQAPLRIDERFPLNEYNYVQLESNPRQWLVTKHSKWNYGWTTSAEVVEIPPLTGHEISEAPVVIPLDTKKFRETFIRASVNISPVDKSLENSTIDIRTPAFVLNGNTYPSRTFTFVTGFKTPSSKQSSNRRCPGISEIFNFND
jgi:hypothetical protein